MNYTNGYWRREDYARLEANEILNKVIGKTVKEVVGASKGSEQVALIFDDGASLCMEHDQDCCETVDVEDINGDISDLVGHPLVAAEESSSDEPSPHRYSESHTWTFYRFATQKGWVVIRWLGESSGYYSEEVAITLKNA